MDVASGSDAASKPVPQAGAALPAQQNGTAYNGAEAGDPFGIDAEVLVGDIRDAVDDFCADGFDALTRCLLSDLPLSGEEQRQEVLEGTEALYQNVKARLDTQMELLQGHALHGCLQIPPGLDVQQAPQPECGDAAADVAKAAHLKSELASLRAAVRAARSDVRQSQAQLASMDRDLAAHGDRTELEAAAAPAAGKENVAADACAIAADAARLRPLLAKAQRLVQAAKPQAQTDSVAAADQDLQKRQQSIDNGSGIDISALRAANQIMGAHAQQRQAASAGV